MPLRRRLTVSFTSVKRLQLHGCSLSPNLFFVSSDTSLHQASLEFLMPPSGNSIHYPSGKRKILGSAYVSYQALAACLEVLSCKLRTGQGGKVRSGAMSKSQDCGSDDACSPLREATAAFPLVYLRNKHVQSQRCLFPEDNQIKSFMKKRHRSYQQDLGC